MPSKYLILSRASNYIALALGVTGGVSLSSPEECDPSLIVAGAGFLVLGVYFWFRRQDEDASRDLSASGQRQQLT